MNAQKHVICIKDKQEQDAKLLALCELANKALRTSNYENLQCILDEIENQICIFYEQE